MSLFSFIIGVGASFALLRLVIASEEASRFPSLFQGLLVQFGILVGARLAFVLAHTAYYSSRKGEIIILSTGGLWWPGALTGGLLIVIAIGLFQKNQVKQALDRFSVMLLPLLVSFWLAGWSAGVAYGSRLDSSIWWGLPALDITGVSLPRVPVQPIAALTALLILGGLEWRLKKPMPGGRCAALLFLAAGVHTLIFSLLRDDPIQLILGFRLDVLASIVFIVVSALLLAFTFEVKSRKNNITKETSL